MKLIIALCLVAAVTAALPPQVNFSDNMELLQFENDNPGTGNYRFAYKQIDGTEQEVQGELRNEGTKDAFVAVKGSFSWVDPNGVIYVVNYVADEGGYQPTVESSEEGPGTGIPAALLASCLG